MAPTRIAPAFGDGTLRAAVRFPLPLIFAGIVLLFVILQARVARRDPKLADAPIRRDDDGMRFG
jgi:hypothetical protein